MPTGQYPHCPDKVRGPTGRGELLCNALGRRPPTADSPLPRRDASLNLRFWQTGNTRRHPISAVSCSTSSLVSAGRVTCGPVLRANLPDVQSDSLSRWRLAVGKFAYSVCHAPRDMARETLKYSLGDRRRLRGRQRLSRAGISFAFPSGKTGAGISHRRCAPVLNWQQPCHHGIPVLAAMERNRAGIDPKRAEVPKSES